MREAAARYAGALPCVVMAMHLWRPLVCRLDQWNIPNTRCCRVALFQWHGRAWIADLRASRSETRVCARLNSFGDIARRSTGTVTSTANWHCAHGTQVPTHAGVPRAAKAPHRGSLIWLPVRGRL